jgi:glucokinase
MPTPVLAIDIGGSKSIVAVCTTDGGILESIRADRPNGKDAFWIRDSIFNRVETLKENHPETFRQIEHCGIGFGGPVRDNKPVVSIHIKGWEEIDLCAEVEARYGLPSCMENDGITQALGEHTYGAGKGRSSLIFANLGTGYGGGVIEDGKPRLGDGGFAGHFGHMCVVPNGRLCPCGNRGCAEAYCSGTGIGERAREAAASGDPAAKPLADRIAQLPEGAGAGPVLLELAREGDPFSLALVEGTLELLSLALSAGVNILDIRLIVIGGGAGIGLAPWFPQLEEKVKARSLSLCREGLEVRLAGLGINTVLLGAVALCGLRLK